MTRKGLILSDPAYDIGNAVAFMIWGGKRLRYPDCFPQATALTDAPVKTDGSTFAAACLN
jgi:hypothetical protein